MKNITLVFLFLYSLCFSQAKTVTGLILDENLTPLLAIEIRNHSGNTIGFTNSEGKFLVEIDNAEKYLEIASLGFETIQIEMTDSCTNLEIIMIYDSTYCFVSPKKANRLRKKSFKRFDKIYKSALEKKMFTHNKCYQAKLKYN